LIAEGKVWVNGKVATGAGDSIHPDKDLIQVEGKRVTLDTDKFYILLNKPTGYLSTTADTHGRPTIMDLLPPTYKRLYPVGRLDMDTEGLLIITNDGELTYRLTHPKHHVDKVYLAWVEGNPTEEALDKLRDGIALEDIVTSPAIVEREGEHCLRITIHEGRKRQVRRMCAAVGHKVQRLKRVQLGSLHLGDLPLGEYRYLSEEEIETLKREADG
jgi:pseudouridine synthase